MEQLASIFLQHASGYATKRDACFEIWNIVEPTLSPQNRVFAKQFGLLQKSKDDVKLDAALRKELSIFDSVINDDPPDDDENFTDQENSPEVLVFAYHFVTRQWHKDGLEIGRRIPCLWPTSSPMHELQPQSLLPVNTQHLIGTNCNIRFIPKATLDQTRLFGRYRRQHRLGHAYRC